MHRIAIIEDDEPIRSTLQALLVAYGYEVILVNGPGDLLAQLAAVGPDLVLLDLVLGAWGDGLALAAAVREHPLLLNLPLIILSAAVERLGQYSNTLTALQCQVLAKPFDLDDLLACIATALG